MKVEMLSTDVPVNTKHLYNIHTTSAQRFRRWSTLYKCYTNLRFLELFSLFPYLTICTIPVGRERGFAVHSRQDIREMTIICICICIQFLQGGDAVDALVFGDIFQILTVAKPRLQLGEVRKSGEKTGGLAESEVGATEGRHPLLGRFRADLVAEICLYVKALVWDCDGGHGAGPVVAVRTTGLCYYTGLLLLGRRWGIGGR